MKVYDDDPLVPYKNTKIGANQTKAEIDGLLARWGIKDSGWRWDPDNQEIFILFQLRETVDGKEITPRVKVEAHGGSREESR